MVNAVAGGQISRIPFRLACPPLPTMMWSCTEMPSGTEMSMIALVVLIFRQQCKPPFVDPLTRQHSSCCAKIGRIELALSALLKALVDHI